MAVPAFESFQNPCMPDRWRRYGGWPTVFILVGVLFVQAVQTIVLDHFAKHQSADNAVDTEHASPEIASLANAQAIHSDGCPSTHAMIQHARDGARHHHRITTVLLEVGVVLHSVIIGITLGVSGGAEFVPLLIAISVHQFFEAIAISAAAMSCGFPTLKFFSVFLCTVRVHDTHRADRWYRIGEHL